MLREGKQLREPWMFADTSGAGPKGRAPFMAMQGEAA
jgi:hypothetical protein